MGNLLNGGTLSDALEKFRLHKQATHKKQNNYYYKVEEYISLLDQCFGIDGYQVHYSEAGINCLPSGQCIILVKALIEILGTDGQIVYNMEGYGTYEIVSAREGGNYINLSTAGMNANVNALKAACINNGAFGKRSEVSEDSAEERESENPQRTHTECSRDCSNNRLQKFFVKQKMEVLWKDKEGKPAYRLKGYEVVEDGRMRSETSEILFYPNQYKKEVRKMNDLVAWASSEETVKNGRVFSFQVASVAENRRNTEYFASYTFKAFAG